MKNGSGDFYCGHKKLTSLEHCPTEVGGEFSCRYNDLTSLEHCPTSVSGDFYCGNNDLTSLEHCPTSVGGKFSCGNNKLTSLEHCPTSVGGYFYCCDNKLTSLQNIHTYLKKMNGEFYADNNPIKSHVLGLLLIEGCSLVDLDNKDVESILNKYLPTTKSRQAVIECQKELIEAGLEEYAKL
jgi:hypothetical protein